MKKDLLFDEDEIEDYVESWEGQYLCIEDEDWPGLLRLTKADIEKNPGDYYAQENHAEALILSKQYDEAIAYLKPLYHKESDPYIYEYLYTRYLLDALYKSGRTEADFKWKRPPMIVKLNDEVLDHCYIFLKGKRKGRSVYELMEIVTDGFKTYATFNDDELEKALIKDARFIVQDSFNITIKKKK